MTAEPDTSGLLHDGITAADLDEVVAPALELALVVARVCTDARPAIPVPRPLRTMVRFAKLPVQARPAVRKALDTDAEFRARVAAVSEEMGLPAAARAFVERTDGWLDLLAVELDQAKQHHDTETSERAERTLQRRLDGAEAAAARFEESALTARVEASRAAEELAEERRSRRELEQQSERVSHWLEAAESERDSARRRLGEQADALATVRAELEGVTRERDALRQEIARLKADQDAASTPAAPTAPEVATPTGDQGREGAADAIASAAIAARHLAEALARAAGALGGVEPGAETAAQLVPPAAPERPRRRQGSGRSFRRRPQALPPAVFDDSPEAAEHLVRVPGMLVLVDGYNVTLNAWQELPISAQRVRLIDACVELAARAGPEVLIVFDGAEEPGDLPAPMGRGRVRWRFSPADVEADDVLLDLVASVEPTRPVMVASSDRRVRDGARQQGANAISTSQLLAALRRRR